VRKETSLATVARACPATTYNRDMAKKPLTPEDREERRRNWLARTGSPQERRFLKKWLVQPGLSSLLLHGVSISAESLREADAADQVGVARIETQILKLQIHL
jgi:hypothetical protein